MNEALANLKPKLDIFSVQFLDQMSYMLIKQLLERLNIPYNGIKSQNHLDIWQLLAVNTIMGE